MRLVRVRSPPFRFRQSELSQPESSATLPVKEARICNDGFGGGERDAILGSPRARQARLDAPEVEGKGGVFGTTRGLQREFGLTPDDVDLYIPHQANIRIINAAIDVLHIPRSRVFNNLHRYALYLALILNVILTIDAVMAFKTPDGKWGYLGLGTLILTANAVALWFYTLSCHSCRNITAGRITHFSKHPVRYKAWTFVSKINEHHMGWAWISLCTVVLADFYVYLLASGRISDLVFFSA